MSEMRRMECLIKIKSSADKFFDAFNTKVYLMPIMSNKLISDIKLLQGDWNSVGSVMLWDYVVGGKHEIVKELREHMDERNGTIVYRMIEGDIMNYFRSWKTTLCVTPMGEGSLVKWINDFEKRNEDIPDPFEYEEFLKSWSENVDAYLLHV